jgi:hypothetical protein
MSLSISSVSQTTQTTAVSSVDATSSSSSASAPTSSQCDSTKFSKRAEMMSKLKDLASSDPEKFKEVTKKISDKLSAAGDTDAAQKFAQASQSGDMSSLAPPSKGSGGGGHHHHHGGGGGGGGAQAYAAAQSSSSKPDMSSIDSVVSSVLDDSGN